MKHLKRPDFNLNVALDHRNVKIFIGEFAPQTDALKQVINYLERDFEGQKKVLDDNNICARLVYTISLECAEPFEHRILYTGSSCRQIEEDRTRVEDRTLEHMLNLLKKLNGFVFVDESLELLYTNIINEITTHKRHLEYHLLPMDTMCVRS